MPFTVSHVAAVLPLHRPLRRLGLVSAAAIGAMAPDLDLMLPNRLPREQTHGLLSLLTFSLPVGLTAWALFQALVKPALVEVLPDRVYIRLRAEHLGPRLASVRAWLSAGLAVLVGALTHIVWDSCTHEDGRGVCLLPVLDEPGELPGSQSRLYRWLQHGSSVVGLAAVLVALCIWARHANWPDVPPNRRLTAHERHLWTALFALIPLGQMVAAAAQIQHAGWPPLYSTPGLMSIAVTGTSSALLSLIFTSALVRRRVLVLSVRSSLPDP